MLVLGLVCYVENRTAEEEEGEDKALGNCEELDASGDEDAGWDDEGWGALDLSVGVACECG